MLKPGDQRRLLVKSGRYNKDFSIKKYQDRIRIAACDHQKDQKIRDYHTTDSVNKSIFDFLTKFKRKNGAEEIRCRRHSILAFRKKLKDRVARKQRNSRKKKMREQDTL
jgi:hypothetical protein